MSHPTPLDITNMPDLVRIAEEVKATRKPRELKRENKTVAVIVPAGAAVQRGSHLHKRTIWTGYDPQRVRAALKQSAGALQGVDWEELLSDLANQRAQKSAGRPI
jgi:anaerobic selenocysteine-containing dehydrogenase